MEPTRACVSASVATDPPTLNSWPHHPLLLTRRRRRLLRSPNQHLPGAHPFRFVFGQNFEIVDWGPAAESIHPDEANTLFFFSFFLLISIPSRRRSKFAPETPHPTDAVFSCLWSLSRSAPHLTSRP